ncbi:MAG: histone-like protein [Exiguobacterium sp.]|jgi:histone H3/H4
MDSTGDIDEIEQEAVATCTDEVPEVEEAKVNKRKSSTPRRSKKAPRYTKTLATKGMKKRRYRPGTVALREIRAMQQTTNLLIPRLPMKMLIKQLVSERQSGIRVTRSAYESIQASAEDFLTELFAEAMKLAVYAGRKQLNVGDLRYVIEQQGMTLSQEYLDGIMKRRLAMKNK